MPLPAHRRFRPRRVPANAVVTLAVLLATAMLATACASSLPGNPQPGPSTSAAISATTDAPPTEPPTPQPFPSPDRPTTESADPATTDPATTDPATTDPATSPVADPDGVAGEPGAGDPYYPTAGNGGYQAEGYHVTLTYDPASGQLEASTRIDAVVTQGERLGQFNLDLQDTMTVTSVTVDGTPAAFEHRGAELTVVPDSGLDDGAGFTVVVDYAGAPGPITGGTSGLGDGGWYQMLSGGALAVGQPFSASAWFPVNEHPSDIATFSVTATVPRGWDVISNGIEFDGAQTFVPPDGWHTVQWDLDTPIASYLITLYIDKFTLDYDALDDGTPIINAYAPGNTKDQSLAKQTKQIIEVLEEYFGAYPFDAAGGIYTNEPLTFALETATRPVYGNWVDLDTVVHEIAHQWYGDYVTIERWEDICLNECFASYAPWLWHAEVSDLDLDELWAEQMAYLDEDQSFWSIPLVDMGAGREFTTVYSRGPLAVHALRLQMGDEAFRQLLKEWPAVYGGGTASFDDLEAMVSQIAGQDMSEFIEVWFRGTEPPSGEFRHPGGL